MGSWEMRALELQMLRSEALPSSYGPVTGWAESQVVSGLGGGQEASRVG